MNRTGEVYRGDQVRNLFVQTHTSGVGFNLLSVMKILKKPASLRRHFYRER